MVLNLTEEGGKEPFHFPGHDKDLCFQQQGTSTNAELYWRAGGAPLFRTGRHRNCECSVKILHCKEKKKGVLFCPIPITVSDDVFTGISYHYRNLGISH